MGLEMGSQSFHPILNGKYRAAEQHKVAAHRRRNCVGGNDVHRSALQREIRLRWVTIPPDNLAGELSSTQRHAGGCTNEAGSYDRDAVDGHREFGGSQKGAQKASKSRELNGPPPGGSQISKSSPRFTYDHLLS